MDIKLNTWSEGDEEGAITNGIFVFYTPINFWQQTLSNPYADELAYDVYEIDHSLHANGTAVFLHCIHGQDRTGVAVGAYRVEVEGWTKAAAYAEMRAHGFHPSLRGLVRAWNRDVVPRSMSVNTNTQSSVDKSNIP